MSRKLQGKAAVLEYLKKYPGRTVTEIREGLNASGFPIDSVQARLFDLEREYVMTKSQDGSQLRWTVGPRRVTPKGRSIVKIGLPSGLTDSEVQALQRHLEAARDGWLAQQGKAGLPVEDDITPDPFDSIPDSFWS